MNYYQIKENYNEPEKLFQEGTRYYTQKNFKQAIHCWGIAATQNNCYAQLYLAREFSKGVNINQDINLAEYWLKRASKNGSHVAKETLFRLYYKNKLYNKAFKYAKELAETFKPNNLLTLSQCYAQGIGCKPNPKIQKAIKNIIKNIYNNKKYINTTLDIEITKELQNIK